MKWRRDASEFRTVWPYPVKENVIKLQVNARLMNCATVSVDLPGESNWLAGREADLVDKRTVLKIYDYDEVWTDVAVQCSVSVDDPDNLRKELLPPGQDVPLSYALLIRCDDTRWRKAVTSSFEGSSADFMFSFARSDVAGAVEVQPCLILASTAAPADGVWACRKAAQIATGFRLYFHADGPMDRPGRGIDVQWAEFGDPIAGALYKLDITADRKVRLCLNNGYSALDPIFKSRSRARNSRTIVRDTLFSFIATDVWSELADIAAHSAIEVEQGEGEELPQLYDNVLRFLSRRLGLDREVIISYFVPDSEGQGRAELRERLQDLLAVAAKAESLVLTAPETAEGGV